MTKKNDTEVLIGGRKYTMYGVESNEYLQQVASYINDKIAQFKENDAYQLMDMELRNVLLAINIADDYFKTAEELQEIKEEGKMKDKQMLDMKHENIRLQDQMKELESGKKEIETELREAEKKIVELETRLGQRSGNGSKRR